MPKPLTSDDYAAIRTQYGIPDTKEFTVVVTKHYGKNVRSVHQFHRPATPTEMMEYENAASKLEFKGSRAKVSGSQTRASEHLYNHLIEKAFNVPVGPSREAELGRADAILKVPLPMKREAIHDLVHRDISEGRLADNEGDEDADDTEGDRPTEGNG